MTHRLVQWLIHRSAWADRFDTWLVRRCGRYGRWRLARDGWDLRRFAEVLREVARDG